MIQSAKNFNIKNTNSSLPNMSNTITGWFLDVDFYEVERKLIGADWVEGKGKKISTKGVVQPPSDKDLKILPEGSWMWEWLMVHCLPNLKLEPNQYIYYDDKKYKVMSKKDFTKYGYIRYVILEAYRADKV